MQVAVALEAEAEANATNSKAHTRSLRVLSILRWSENYGKDRDNIWTSFDIIYSVTSIDISAGFLVLDCFAVLGNSRGNLRQIHRILEVLFNKLSHYEKTSDSIQRNEEAFARKDHACFLERQFSLILLQHLLGGVRRDGQNVGEHPVAAFERNQVTKIAVDSNGNDGWVLAVRDGANVEHFE
jgi:hypothetical protein